MIADGLPQRPGERAWCASLPTNFAGTSEKLSTEALKKLTQGMTAYLLETLKSLGKRKPGQKGLRERITQSLESRSALDSEAGE